MIGHWYEKPSARDAALKAFIVTRIGDAALFVAIIIFWAYTGTTSFDGISEAAQAGSHAFADGVEVGRQERADEALDQRV